MKTKFKKGDIVRLVRPPGVRSKNEPPVYIEKQLYIVDGMEPASSGRAALLVTIPKIPGEKTDLLRRRKLFAWRYEKVQDNDWDE